MSSTHLNDDEIEKNEMKTADYRFELIRKALFKYYTYAMVKNLPISQASLKYQARKYFNKLKTNASIADSLPSNFNASSFWLLDFANKYNINLEKIANVTATHSTLNCENESKDDDIINEIVTSVTCGSGTSVVEPKQEPNEINEYCETNNEQVTVTNQSRIESDGMSHDEGALAFKTLCRYLKQFDSITDTDIASITNIYTKSF